MEIIVNGRSQSVTEGVTLGGLIAQLELDVRRIVIEYNRSIVMLEQLDTVVLKPNDSVEIVNFVAGG